MYSRISLFVCLAILTGCSSAQYHGLLVGQLRTFSHRVSGLVYAVDANTIQIVNFVYDGLGPAAVFWVGFNGDHQATPSSGAVALRGSPRGNIQKIPQYSNERVLIDLPSGKTVNDVLWLSIWCEAFNVDFGSVLFPSLGPAPAPLSLGQFSRLAHAVSSGEVTLLDSKTFRIRGLTYDGTGPDAWMMVGKDSIRYRDNTRTPLIDDPYRETNTRDGRWQRRYPVPNMPADITIRIPGDQDVRTSSLEWLSLYCKAANQDFGNVNIPANANVPPYILSENCEEMDDKFQVAWTVEGENIMFEFRGRIEDDEYMAFGLSGSDSATTMDGGDVTVVHFLQNRANAEDYDLNARAQCSGGVGACPDRLVSGAEDNVSEVSGSRVNGITRVKFTRKLITGDPKDKEIKTTGSQRIIWAVGRYGDGAVTKHSRTINRSGNIVLAFGRTVDDNCDPLEEGEVVTPEIDPWQIPLLSGKDGKVFTIKLGPSGGDKGYTAITGQNAWGIAFYVNNGGQDWLIPEIELRRNETYTFRIQTGNDENNQAQYHPFYITSDRKGGHKQRTTEERRNIDIYAGLDQNGNPLPNAAGPLCDLQKTQNLNKMETEYNTYQEYYDDLTQVPASCPQYGELTWTVPLNAPDVLYYHCWTHQFLGWKLRIVQEYGEERPSSSVLPSINIFAIFVSIFLTLFMK